MTPIALALQWSQSCDPTERAFCEPADGLQAMGPVISLLWVVVILRGSPRLVLVGLWLVACGKTELPGACGSACGGTASGGAPGSGGRNSGASGAVSGGGSQAGGSNAEGGGAAGAPRGGTENAGGVSGAAHAGEGGASAGQSSLGGSAGVGGGGQPSAGAAGSGYVHEWKTGRASCVDVDCDAYSNQSSSANCCYASASDHGCGTASVNGCSSFPATLLHCDSGGDCAHEPIAANRRCVLDLGNRLALCGGVPDGTTQIQLCEPSEACTVGSCRQTTLSGKLPPNYWACLP